MKRFNSGSVTLKVLTIGAVILVLLIPLSMLRGLTSERAGLREQAHAKVAAGWGGAVMTGGPMLIVPTERSVVVNGASQIERCDIYLLPARLNAVADIALEAERRYVGLYAAPVYVSQVKLTGEFDLSDLQPLLNRAGVTYLWKESRVHLPIGDVRGLRAIDDAVVRSQTLEFGPGKPAVYSGVAAPLDASTFGAVDTISFSMSLKIAGSREWSFLPLSGVTSVELSANWPHPAFQGAFLPLERSISDDRFTARWQVLELNRAFPQAWWSDEIDAAALQQAAFGVGLHQPVDIYQRGERAVKYALVFIALTFVTFFAWEQLSDVRLHPLQYLLVGFALSTFYLLLIALSEHIAFGAAYAIAAAALIALLAVYVAGALHSRARGAAVGVAMSLIYGVLYVLVLSEDYALLLGAVTLFTALGGLMLATRKVDWYRVGARQSA